MAHIYASRVFETSISTGTGAMALAGTAPTGFRPFSAVMTSPSDTCVYLIQGIDANGNPITEWELGIGTYSAANTLTRTLVLESSNANAAVAFSAGTKQVAIAASAQRVAQFDAEFGLRMPNATTDPSTPAAGFGVIFHKEIAGLGQLRTKNAQGLDHSVQMMVAYNRLETCRGGEATPTVFGGIPSVSNGATPAPAAGVAPASTNLATSLRNTVYATTTTTGQIGSQVSQPARLWRGNAAGLGGYRFVHRFSLLAAAAGMRVFVGLADSVTSLINVDYTTATTPGKIGLAINTNSGNWNLVYNLTGAAPTVVALGANFPVNTTDVLELELACAPNSAGVGYRVRNLSTGAETSGTITTNQPANTTFLAPSLAITNNATASVVSLRHYYWTAESDN